MCVNGGLGAASLTPRLEALMASDAQRLLNGIWAYIGGATRDENPHKPGSFEHELWDDDWVFQAQQARPFLRNL